MKLHYQISGEGSPLIILHGLFGTLENWGSQASTFSQHFKVINVDLRNHGRSPHCDEMSYTLMADDILELMDHLKIDNAAVMGHSMGGKVAMQFALQSPKRVQKLIVVDISPVTYCAHHETIFQSLSCIDLDSLTSRSSADKQLQKNLQDAGIRAFLLKNLYRKENQTFAWRPNLSILHKEYEKLSQAPSGTPFNGNTLFIKGKNSDYILAGHQDAIQSLFTLASFKIIEGAGHWPHAEKPNVFSSIVLKFLQKKHDV
jgi:esterase